MMLLYPVYPIRFASDLSAIIKEFVAVRNVGSMLGVKEPASHPYLCLQINEDRTIEHFINEDMQHYYRRQSYPEYFELTHWAYICATAELPKLNNQLINEKHISLCVAKTSSMW